MQQHRSIEDYGIDLVLDGRDFNGTFPRTLDGKGRMVVPPAFRDESAEGLFVMEGYDQCLEVWTREGYTVRKLEVLRDTRRNRRHRDERLVVSSARPLDLDGQHRMTLPHELRDKIGLDREIVVQGNIDHFEIWDAREFDRVAERASSNHRDTDVEQ